MREKSIVGLWVGLLLSVLLTAGVFADEKMPPQVTTLPADTITYESAILRGSYAAGTDAVVERGFKYRPVGTDEAYKTVKVPGDNTVARFGYILRDLESETAYEAVAYVKTSDAVIEGEKTEFVTPAVPAEALTVVTAESPATGAYEEMTAALPAICLLAMALAISVMTANKNFIQ